MAPTGPVDWKMAERVALRLSGTEQLSRSYHYSSLTPDFEELTPLAEQLVEETTGLRSSAGAARPRVVDRADWVRVNLASFQRLLRPLLQKFDEQLSGHRGLARATTRSVAGAEVGALLGWMSQRVLGQYDLLVIGDDRPEDQDLVYFVGPNLLSLEKRFGFPPREFRLWLALHEVTHRAQFTGVPWMREHFLSLVEQNLAAVDPDPQRLISAFTGAARQGRHERRQALRDGGVMALLASPEQKAILGRIGGLMALLEGHGDVTMDRAGATLVPSAERFARVLRERRSNSSMLVRLIQRLSGLEGKLAQYELGEQFIAAIEADSGVGIIERCWDSPDNLPTLEEIRAPRLWLDRLGVAASR